MRPTPLRETEASAVPLSLRRRKSAATFTLYRRAAPPFQAEALGLKFAARRRTASHHPPLSLAALPARY